MSCSSNDLGIALTFFLTAIFTTAITLVLTLLFVRMCIKRTGLTEKEPVKHVEQVPYEEMQMQSPSVNSPEPLTIDLTYDFLDHH